MIFNFLTTLHILLCAFLIFHVFQCFSPYSRLYNVCVSFSTFFNFHAIFKVLQCVFLILHVFQCFLPYSRSYHVSFSFSSLVSFLYIFQVLECVSIFSGFSDLSPYTRCYSVHFLFFTCFSVFRHIPVPTRWLFFHFTCWSVFLPYARSYSVCVSFSMFFRFLTIMHVLQCTFLIFQFFSVSHHISCPTMRESHFLVCHFTLHIPCPTVCVSQYLRFSGFFFFLPLSMSYGVHFSFFTYFSVSHHIPGLYQVIFSFSLLVTFLAIFQVLQYAFLIFHVFHSFSP